MRFLEKLVYRVHRLIFWFKEKNRNAKTPDYSRKQLIFKAIHIFLGALCMDQTGIKLYWFESEFYYRRLTYDQAYGLEFAVFAALHGLFMGLTFFRILELFWFGRKKLNELRQF